MNMLEVDRAAGQNVRYPGIGYCIYCRSTSALTEEHIIPMGLEGNGTVFEDASCPECQIITQGFEGIVLQRCWGMFRNRVDALEKQLEKVMKRLEERDILTR